MPNIDQITPVFYEPSDPYHHEFDNQPLRNIITRQEIINGAVDINAQTLRDARGTAGTVGNRIDQSLAASGALIPAAIDDTEHNIGAHTDGEFDGEEYVRMLSSERDKLELIASEATDLSIRFETAGPSATPITFDSGVLPFDDSATITWRLDGPTVKADTAFPSDAAHNHFYDREPVDVDTITPDFTNYKVTTTSTAYIEGSLRVYINGSRLGEEEAIWAPGFTPSDAFVLIKYTPDADAGTFALSTAITASDVIRIDFDTAFV
jgi:hypothetical protein